jgi:hypothetical protein
MWQTSGSADVCPNHARAQREYLNANTARLG